MPTTYTHYRFGEEVRQLVNEKAAHAIDAFPGLYHIGLHGPDLLFYYNALGKNAINQQGVGLHSLPGSYFFQNAAEVIRRNPGQEAYLAYVYGFLCHFALDVGCHGYIGEQIAVTGITHSEIEAELDRELMAMDGLNPIRHRVTGHLKATEENAAVIKDFFRDVDTKQMKKCIKDMITILNFLVAPSKGKRRFICSMLKLAGHPELGKLIINYVKNPECIACTNHLLELYEQSKTVAAGLIDHFDELVAGTGEADPIYHYNFNTILKEEGGSPSEI